MDNDFSVFTSLPEGFRTVEDQLDHKLASLTVTQAFADYGYPIPSAHASHSCYMRAYYELSEEWLSNAEQHGTVLTNDDYSAVMVLVPMEKCCLCDIDAVSRIVAENSCEETAANMRDIVSYIAADEEKLTLREGTAYIEAFAVQTPKQGQKLGSKLMRQLIRECNEQDRDIFLFTNTEKNAAIYTHFGFETLLRHEEKELNSTTWFMLKRPD